MNLKMIFGIGVSRGFRPLVALALAGALASGAVARGTVPKDKEQMKEMLRKKADQIHRDMLREGQNRPLVDANSNPLAAAAAAAAEEPPAPAQAQAAPADVKKDEPVGTGPRLVFDLTQHDWGVQNDGIPLVCKFSFRNRGTETLEISAINTGCGCTAAKLGKQSFAPGEGDAIEITYNPKGSGKQQRAIQVNSNDAQQPNMQLIIAAQIVPLVEARPNTVQFGTMNIGESRTLQLVVVSRDKDMKITGVEVNGPEISAELAPDAKPEILIESELPGVAVVNVSLKDSAPVGRVLRMVTLKVLASKEPGAAPEPQDVHVNAFAVVKGELTINPQLIRVPPLAAGADFEREVIVTRAQNKAFSITKAEVVNSTLPGVIVTTEPYQEGEVKGFKVKLKGQAGPTANNFRGAIMLSTDVEKEQAVEVQFSGIVRVPPSANPVPAGPPTGAVPPREAPGTSPQSAIPVTPQPAPAPR